MEGCCLPLAALVAVVAEAGVPVAVAVAKILVVEVTACALFVERIPLVAAEMPRAKVVVFLVLVDE
jgi:hypothetical protein